MKIAASTGFAILRAAWYGSSAAAPAIISSPPSQAGRAFPSSLSLVQRPLLWTLEGAEGYTIHPRECAFVRNFLYVGANGGQFAAQFFDKFKYFYLFEPGASAFAILKETLALNPEVRAEVFNIAVSNVAGDIPFFDFGECSGVSRTPMRDERDAPGQIRVACDTLDNLLGDKVTSAILKVDVEGMEERVFAGARRMFAEGVFALVLFERLERTNLERVLSFFEEFGYVVFHIDERGEPSVEPAVISRPLINLFACPRSRLKELKFTNGRSAAFTNEELQKAL
jgi:FkbM family methyltransferase